MALSYQQLWEEQKKKNPYLTPSNAGTVKPTGSGANVVAGASADLGAGKATPVRVSGGNVVSGASADLGAGRATGGSKVTAEERAAAYATPAITPTKKNPSTGAAGYDWQAAVKAATDSAKAQKDSGKIQTRYGAQMNYSPYLDDDEDDGVTEIDSKDVGGAYDLTPKDGGINYDTINKLLTRYGVSAADIGVPVEAMYLGNNQYALPYLLAKPDNYTFMSDGKLTTVGEYKKRLTNGAYVPGSTMPQTAAQPTGAYGGDYEADPYGAYEDGESGAYSDYLEAAVEAILGQKDEIDQEAAAAKQQAYANYMRSRLSMGEQTAGMATGMADSLAIQNDLMLQNELNAIEQQRLNAYAEVDKQAAQMQAEGKLQLAQMAADAEQQAYERAMQERKWAYDLAQDAKDDEPTERVYEISELDKMYENGVISFEQYQQLAGFAPTGATPAAPAERLTSAEAESQIRQTLGNYLTKNDVANMLNIMMANGQITEKTAREVAPKFGLEME